MNDLILKSGLSKVLRWECQEAVEFCRLMISFDGSRVPIEQRDWKIGQTFSWHYAKNVEYRVHQLINFIEDMTMAKPKRGNNRNADFSSYVFVKCELNAEDKKAAKIWIEENTAEFGPLLHDIIASDYKFTCSFSSEHDTFTACLVGKEDNPINGKKTLTARHKDWIVAGLTVLYKHLVVFQGGVWENAIEDEDDGWA